MCHTTQEIASEAILTGRGARRCVIGIEAALRNSADCLAGLGDRGFLPWSMSQQRMTLGSSNDVNQGKLDQRLVYGESPIPVFMSQASRRMGAGLSPAEIGTEVPCRR